MELYIGYLIVGIIVAILPFVILYYIIKGGVHRGAVCAYKEIEDIKRREHRREQSRLEKEAKKLRERLAKNGSQETSGEIL